MAQGHEHGAADGRTGSTGPLGLIEFVHRGGAYTGAGTDDREWRITTTVTGWRLEFRDPGDAAPTYAGTHVSLEAAQREASADHPRPAQHLARQGGVPAP